MMQSSSYSRPATITPAAVIRATPWPSVSTRWVFGLLKACRYSSWKQGRLHSWRYQAFNRAAVTGSRTQRRHLGVEQHVVVQAEPPADALTVSQDLRAVHVLLGRHVPGLFEQRQ